MKYVQFKNNSLVSLENVKSIYQDGTTIKFFYNRDTWVKVQTDNPTEALIEIGEVLRSHSDSVYQLDN